MVESLFSLSMARGLVQLQELHIDNCMMESIVSSSESGEGGEHGITTIAAADQIEFPKLRILSLFYLPSFITFCKVGNSIALPQLNDLKLSNIPKLKSLCYHALEINSNTIIRPLFDKKRGPTQFYWLRNLTSVSIWRCGMVESLFSLSMARGLVQLQELDIYECEMMESIVSSSESGGGGGEHGITTMAAADQIEFPKLRNLSLVDLPSFITLCKVVIAIDLPQLNDLYLEDIPKLRNLCNPTSSDTANRPLFDEKSGPTQLHWLRNLTSLSMSKFRMVESLFSLSMARGLMQLQELDIYKCEMMESIVSLSEGGGGRGEHEITITATADQIVFPKLQKLSLRELPSFIAFSKTLNTIELPQLNYLRLQDIPKLRNLCNPTSEINSDTANRPLFDDKVNLTNIQNLSLSQMDNLIEIWPGELQPKLREMRFYMCHKLLNDILFPSNLIECLQNLELLEVKECRSVKVAFDFRGQIVREGHPVVALLSLQKVELFHLPKLTHVWMNNSPGIQRFSNLESLRVKGCGNLRNLFSFSLAKLLVKLQKLEITECVAMETIIAKEEGVDGDEVTTTNTIVFPRLTSLILNALPNLMSFCPQGFTFDASFLERVQVINCPNMETLPSAFQHKQELWRSNDGFHEAVQKTDKAPRKFMLSNKREFIVTEIDDATKVWHSQLEVECPGQVIRMWVQCCGKLSSVVSTSLIQRFHNLEQLKVWWCDSVEVIFDLEEECVEKGTTTKLSEMEFKYLPKLMDIWKINFSQQTHCFQNLRSLKVKRCDNLTYLFTLSMAKVFVNLEYLKVGHCEKVEKIVSRKEGEEEEEEEEESGSRTILPKLWRISLKDLPSLMCVGVPYPYPIEAKFCPNFNC